MKTAILLTIISIILPMMGYGQSRIGNSLQELRTEFLDPEYDFEIEMVEDDLTVHYQSNDYFILHYLDKEKRVYFTLIFPQSDASMHGFIQFLNDNFVILSDLSWRQYTATQILDIHLVMNSDNPDLGPVFSWQIYQE